MSIKLGNLIRRALSGVAKKLFRVTGVAVLLCPPVVSATVIQYRIDVNVTAASNVPGAYAFTSWSFPSGAPATFSGTFAADDSATGPIGALSLIVGGVDVLATHPFVVVNAFNPTTLGLEYSMTDAPGPARSLVTFGHGKGAPENYAAAIESSVTPPFDPFYLFSQNWVGTFSISRDSQSVPEPATLALVAAAITTAALSRCFRR